jgi:hypothetical protein
VFGLLELLILILVLAWVFGLGLFQSLGALVHLILVLAIIIFLFRVLSGAYTGGRGNGPPA